MKPTANHDEDCMLNANSGPLSPPICTCTVENDHILSIAEGLARWEKLHGSQGVAQFVATRIAIALADEDD